jgi:membrane-associated phospholipid phosphatase
VGLPLNFIVIIAGPSALWACSVGFSRMNQGVHYPSDVLAGAVLGTGCAFANVYINKWLKKWLLPSVKKEITICY